MVAAVRVPNDGSSSVLAVAVLVPMNDAVEVPAKDPKVGSCARHAMVEPIVDSFAVRARVVPKVDSSALRAAVEAPIREPFDSDVVVAAMSTHLVAAAEVPRANSFRPKESGEVDVNVEAHCVDAAVAFLSRWGVY